MNQISALDKRESVAGSRTRASASSSVSFLFRGASDWSVDRA
jgi:hypothetical protein